MFHGYNGENASDFQDSSVTVANKLLKFCFKNNLNFIFDGTFRSYQKVKQNLNQCRKHNRNVLITLIFQEPKISFYYTFLRKMEQTRNVPVDVFID
jgi:Zeta toxin